MNKNKSQDHLLGTRMSSWFSMGHAKESSYEMVFERAITDLKPHSIIHDKADSVSVEIYLVTGIDISTDSLNTGIQLIHEKCDLVSEDSYFSFFMEFSKDLLDTVELTLIIKGYFTEKTSK